VNKIILWWVFSKKMIEKSLTLIELLVQIESIIFALECRCHFDVPLVASVIGDHKSGRDWVSDFSQDETNTFHSDKISHLKSWSIIFYTNLKEAHLVTEFLHHFIEVLALFQDPSTVQSRRHFYKKWIWIFLCFKS